MTAFFSVTGATPHDVGPLSSLGMGARQGLLLVTCLSQDQTSAIIPTF